MVVKGIVHPEM